MEEQTEATGGEQAENGGDNRPDDPKQLDIEGDRDETPVADAAPKTPERGVITLEEALPIVMASRPKLHHEVTLYRHTGSARFGSGAVIGTVKLDPLAGLTKRIAGKAATGYPCEVRAHFRLDKGQVFRVAKMDLEAVVDDDAEATALVPSRGEELTADKVLELVERGAALRTGKSASSADPFDTFTKIEAFLEKRLKRSDGDGGGAFSGVFSELIKSEHVGGLLGGAGALLSASADFKKTEARALEVELSEREVELEERRLNLRLANLRLDKMEAGEVDLPKETEDEDEDT